MIPNFRIKERLLKIKNAEDPCNGNEGHSNKQHASVSGDDSKLSPLLLQFKNLITSLVKQNTQKDSKTKTKCCATKQLSDLEPRDRFVKVDLPEFDDEEVEDEKKASQIRQEKIEAWVGDVCKISISIGFNYYMKKQVTQGQMKAFISQNFLRNIVRLVQNLQITPKEMQMIDKLLRDQILPYMKARYPLSAESEVNKKIQSLVKQIDNSKMVKNDYMYSSDIAFEYRKNGRYDDLIMRLINEVMTRCDAPSSPNDEYSISNYKQFSELMKSTFEKSYDEAWMNSSESNDKASSKKEQKKTKKESEEEEYEHKVKEYTSFLIGRKISQNTEHYTEKQIQSQHISIKSPAILRILTKWCEELWHKFEDRFYLIDRDDGFCEIKKKEIQFINESRRHYIESVLSENGRQIKKLLEKISKINYKQQVEILNHEFDSKENVFIQKEERIAAKFSWKAVNNIEHFIVEYLNRLIHGLTQAALRRQKRDGGVNDQKTLNLVTFGISDLFRCKFASKEKEVLKIFKEFERISNQTPQKFKIIRIKNRLKKGTNDIMINAKFNNLMNCEIQLAVKTTHSDFMHCSNKINHFIYELERAQFGPIMEICSVWRHCEKKSDIYGKLISKEKPRKRVKPRSVKQQQISSDFSPFICLQCSRHYTTNSYFVSHERKNQDQGWICAPCLIQERYNKEDRKFFFEHDPLIDEYEFCRGVSYKEYEGACIFINQSKKEVNFYKITWQNFNRRRYVIFMKYNKPEIVRDITSEQQFNKFKKQFLLFGLQNKTIYEHFHYLRGIFENQIDKNHSIPDYFKQCFRNKKQIITLRQKAIQPLFLENIFQENKKMLHCIQNINLQHLQLVNADFLSPGFENLKILNVSKNVIQKIPKISPNIKLEKLKMDRNRLFEISGEIQLLPHLRYLSINQNKIKKISSRIGQLKCLKTLYLKRNLLEEIPAEIGQLSSLQTLNLNLNLIRKLPAEIGNMRNLKYLYLNQNNLEQLPEQIGNFSSLQRLCLQFNKMKKIHSKIGNLAQLKYLNIHSNGLQEIPVEIGKLKSLQKLYLNFNKLKKLPSSIKGLKNLKYLDVHQNELEQIPSQIGQFSLLQELYLQLNQLKSIPSTIGDLTRLKSLNLSENYLKQIPEEIGQLKSLQKLNLSFNEIEKLPVQIGTINKLNQLNLNSNYLKQVPQNICKLKQLKMLNLGSNQLKCLPEEINLLNQLKMLFLHQNNLQEIPEGVCKLTLLQKLNLTSNKIKQIPQSIVKMTSLKSLHIYANQLQQIPDFIVEIKQLRWIDARSNKAIFTLSDKIKDTFSREYYKLYFDTEDKNMNRLMKIIR